MLQNDSIHLPAGDSPECPLMRGAQVADWFADAATRRWLRALAARLRDCPSRDALRRTPFWPQEGPRLRRLLRTIQCGAPGSGPGPAAVVPQTPRPGAPARDVPDAVRIVAWNILKGLAFEEIAAALTGHPDLAQADVLLLNEVDVGMVRSGNRHGAAELAARLGRHWAFLPNFFELTKGPGEEGRTPGENAIGLHGIAILSRQAPRALRVCPLPECFDAFAFSEKRYGGRAGLLAELPGPWVVGTVHLEVRDSPACRARQMRAYLSALERFCEDRGLGPDVPVLLGGDLNTHTFARGTLLRALRGYLRLRLTARDRLAAELREPWRQRREPLFAELERGGLQWRELNDRTPTAAEKLGRIEDWALLPRPWRRRAADWLGLGEREIALRLDWFFGRGLEVAPGEGRARAVRGLCRDGRPSDHAPIVLELAGRRVERIRARGDT